MAVRRRAVRAEKFKRRAMLAALFVLLAGVAAVVIVNANRAPEIPVIERKGDQSVTFASYSESDVQSIYVKNSEGEYTLVQQDGVWRMQGREDFVFSENMLTPLVAAASLVYAEHKVMDLAGSGYQLRDFGLGDSAIRVEVSYADGTQAAFRIGEMMPQETPMYYLYVEGYNAVYAVGQDVQEIFMLHADALHAVTDPALNGELIDKIDFAGENAFTMAREDGEWYMTSPFRYPLSSASVNTLLGKLEKIRFAQYVSREERADLAAYGLLSPRRTMTVGIAPSILTGYDENGQAIASRLLEGYELTFLCGEDQGDVLFYCLYRGDVVLATRFSASVLLTQTYDTLLSSTPFALSVSELTRLAWTSGGETRAWDITLHERVLENNQFETDDSGNILYDVRVWQDGREVDSEEFLLFYSRLIDVQTINRLPADYQATGAPEIEIALHRGEKVRKVALYAYGELHYAVSVDGVAVYYISRDAVDGLVLPG